MAPDTEDEAALPEGEAAVGDVVEVGEQPVIATTSRTTTARGLMGRVWSTYSIPEPLGAAESSSVCPFAGPTNASRGRVKPPIALNLRGWRRIDVGWL